MKKIYISVLGAASFLFGLGASAQTTTFTFTGSMDSYIVPAGVSAIKIECWGAQGAGDNGTTGGLGAYMSGNFTVTPGEEFKILVGGQGTADPGSPNSCGGGGGSFVTDLSDNPMIIAGGGGGTNGAPLNGNEHAPVTNDGLDGYSPSTPTAYGVGGTAGSGATNAPSGPCAGNGGGLLTNGQDPSCCSGLSVGVAFVNGGDAALIGGCGTASPGGFGGGGAGGYHGAGGGGGYSGGGANYHFGGNGGGGGSYNDGTDQVNIAGDNSGDGQIIITVLCTALSTTVSSDTVCVGEEVILHAESTIGGTVTWDGGISDSIAFTIDSAGVTTYTATSDTTDCDFVVDIFVKPAPVFTLGATDELTGSDGTTNLTLTDGIFPFSYDWDNDGTGDFDDEANLSGLSAGWYTVTVMQANGCTTTDSVQVNSQLWVKELGENVKLYPNPAVEQITIEGMDNFEYSIIDVRGKLVLAGNGGLKENISLSSIDAGVYMIKIEYNGLVQTIQLIKE